ncbi:MAG: DUF1385 domain-containing protein [Calditrichaeota bacterium]|nr:DUF1385 domain-containing protein [Calditrichota bacterium]
MPNTKVTVGGQAVIEGVMMRAPGRVAVAVRKPNGNIVVKSECFESITKKIKLLGWPFLRGAVVLIESLVLGVRALSFSGDIAVQEEDNDDGQTELKEKSKLAKLWMGITVLFSFVLGLGLFFYVPLMLTGLFHLQSGIAFNLVDGIFRLMIFLAYIYLITLWKDIRRIFEYHGAEHKSVFTFEDMKELNVDSAKPYSTLHPRCGTSFLLIVMLVSIVVFMFLGRPDNIAERLLRLAFVPVIGGISYELIRLSDKGYKNNFFKIFILPGLWLQKLTTREPDESQLEVALVALKSALGEEPKVGLSEVEVLH